MPSTPSPPSPLPLRYSEISPETAAATDAHGELLFNAGNICNHVYTLPCLHSFSTAAIPYHVAHKKIPVADAQGVTHTPPSNNGIKLERSIPPPPPSPLSPHQPPPPSPSPCSFIFDAFETVAPSSFFCMEVARAAEFAPVKNASGVDSPASARAAVGQLHRDWVLAAGGEVEGEGVVEVGASLSYEGEGLQSACEGKVFVAPVVIV